MLQRLKFWLGRMPFFRPTATGERGERLAADFLRRRGYRVVASNWRSPRDRRDEIDLICRDGEVLVFVEVKTRAANAQVSGYYAVDNRKKAVVRRAASVYMRQLRPRPHTFRFDVVEVAVEAGGHSEVRHYENVELFSKHFRP
ncbi:MAG: YraN family protein [Opitutaceae bacterium]|jgi:putative endonuclease